MTHRAARPGSQAGRLSYDAVDLLKGCHIQAHGDNPWVSSLAGKALAGSQLL